MKTNYKILILLAIFMIVFVYKAVTPYETDEIILADSNINGDNKVNAQDYILIRKHIMGIKLTGERLKKADVNRDDSINSKDYILIRKAILSGKPITEVKPVTKYKVTFNANGGSVSTTSKEISSGDKYGEMPTPTRSEYKFVGWFTVKNGSFDYKYYSNKYSDLKKNFGTNEKALKEHWYIFGIKEGRTCSENNVSPLDTVKANITLYAGWEKLEKVKYKITFNANSGSVSTTSKEVTAGDKYGDMPTPTRSGYKFVGWFTVNSGSFDYEYYYNKYDDLKRAFGLNEESLRKHWFNNGLGEGRVCSKYNISKLDAVTSNVTLYAGWEALPYTIKFDANGGSVSTTSKEVKPGTAIGDMPTPTRDGYRFVGWFKVASGEFDYTYYSDVNSDLKRSFGYNEKKLKEHWYIYGRDEGRTCSKDSVTKLGTVTGNTTFYAGWERISDSFVITHYWGINSPYINDTQARYLKDAGFNLVMLSGGNYYKNHDAYVAGMGTALNKLNEYGLDAIVWGWTSPIHFGKSETDAMRESYIKQTINDFSKYSNVKEYYVGDEPPSQANFEAIDKIIDYIHKYDPGREGTMNLLPDGPHQGGDYRKDYLIPYAKNVSGNTLSFDRYVFDKSGGVDKAGLFKNLEEIYYVARDYEKVPTAIVLLTEHLNFKNLTRNDIAFEASVSLAYGMKRISYFTYSVDEITGDGFTNAMLNVNHDRTTHYYDVQSVNKWLKKLGNELYSTKMVEVYGFGEGNQMSYNKYDSSTTLTVSQSGLIAMFENKSYLLVNTAIANSKDNVFTFKSIDNVEFYDFETNKWTKLRNTSNSNYVIDTNKKQIIIKPGYCILLRGGNYWRSAGTWKTDNRGVHFVGPTGSEVKSDWVKSKGYWYYINSSGNMVTGWQQISKNGKTNWYYFDNSGELLYGWIKYNSHWYYTDSNGVMVANKCQKIGDSEFCFDSSGACYKGTGC